jgi:hypothetical protein
MKQKRDDTNSVSLYGLGVILLLKSYHLSHQPIITLLYVQKRFLRNTGGIQIGYCR